VGEPWQWYVIKRHADATAWKMSRKFADKTDISFTDFTSFIIMKELRITEALTANRRFDLVGLGFNKLF